MTPEEYDRHYRKKVCENEADHFFERINRYIEACRYCDVAQISRDWIKGQQPTREAAILAEYERQMK